MLKRPHYIALGLVVLLTLVILNLPGKTVARLKLAIGSVFAPLASLTGSGVVSAAGNRRAFRISEEPLDSFRRYMSVYAREQAHCHLSPALIANLERNWNAATRRA